MILCFGLKKLKLYKLGLTRKINKLPIFEKDMEMGLDNDKHAEGEIL